MRLACPTCATAYEIPDRVLGTGARKLRCAHCGTEWTYAPPPLEPPPDGPGAESAPPLPRYQEAAGRGETPAAADAALELAVSEPSMARNRARRALSPQPDPVPPDPVSSASAPSPAMPPAEARPDRSAPVWLAWAATIVVIALLVWGGYVFRTEVMHLWPASQRLYALLGIGPAPQPAPQ